VLAIAFGETFLYEAYLRRISLIKHKPTKEIFDKLGALFVNYSIVEKAGNFRDDDLLTSD